MQLELQKNSRGFTLIELLVVIAIIGILAAIILASLSTARSKGNDSKVTEQLVSLRNAGEAYYTGNNNYGAAGDSANCTVDGMALDTTTGFSNLVASSSWPSNVMPVCVTNGTLTTPATSFAAWHILSDGTSYWCVDSTGVSKTLASAPASNATACP